MIESTHNAYNKDRMHVHEIGLKDQMCGAYKCAFVHVDMLEQVDGMSVY